MAKKKLAESVRLAKRLKIGFMIFVILAVVFFGIALWADSQNISQDIGPNLRFDWIAASCSLGAMLASIYLGLIATVQNESANEQNKRLASINEKQLENAILSQGHPLIRFSKIQRFDEKTSIFYVRIIDVHDTVLKKAYTRDVKLQPLSEKYKEDEKAKKIEISSSEIESKLQLTYLHGDINKGLYMIDVKMKKEILETHRYYRLEFETDVISVTGIVSKNKCFALIDTEFKYCGMKDREYFEVYHQFCEVREIISEDKYNKQRCI